MTTLQEGRVASPRQTLANTSERWALVLRHRERLLSIARRRLHDRHHVEDCVHDALLRCASFEELDDRRVGEFLTTTLIRLCVDYRRRARRAQLLEQRVWISEATCHPEELLCDRATGQRLLREAARLRGRERQVLMARARGLSTAEAASLLGISLKAAESAFTRGRARLRACWPS